MPKGRSHRNRQMGTYLRSVDEIRPHLPVPAAAARSTTHGNPQIGAQVRDAGQMQPQEPADEHVPAQRGRDTPASAGSRTAPRHPAPGNPQMGTHLGQADTTQPQQPADTRTSQRHRRNSRPSAGSCTAKKTGTSRYLAIFERQRPGTSHLRPDGNPRPTTPPQS